MKKALVTATMVGITLLSTGCAMHTGNPAMAKMEKKAYTDPIVNGKTTKSEVQKLLGDPNTVNITSKGDTKWTYVYERRVWKPVNYLPIINWFINGTDDTRKELVVTFNDHNVVQKHTTTKAVGETMHGIGQ